MRRTDTSENIPLKIGNSTVLWNKIMKEVKAGRYAGPFQHIPFDNYMQSPIGLVPKAKNKAKLIFHLSYQFKSGLGSLNSNTPKEKCSVKYRDLDYAIRTCIELLQNLPTDQPIFYTKSDLVSAFRILPCKIDNFKWLVMKAVNPKTGEIVYFVDKCLPFGASISCALFQEFSNALQHITQFAINRNTRRVMTNYLDDFLFIAAMLMSCNAQVLKFLKICEDIGCPVSLKKTEWATPMIIFLGILLDGINRCLCIPIDKKIKAVNLLSSFISKNKATVKQIQQLTGVLNFLSKAIVPGRAFTRRMYSKIKLTDSRGRVLSDYHHVRIDKEFKSDCMVWLIFLEDEESKVLCRPFMDLDRFKTLVTMNFYSDVSGKIGFRTIFDQKWLFGLWDDHFLKQKPSIEYQELFALCCAILSWQEYLFNIRMIIFCDNQAVVEMVNSTTSSCPNCMILICMLVLNNLQHNRRVFVKYIFSKNNYLADALSRNDLDCFHRLAKNKMESFPTKPSEMVWPIDKIWLKQK